MKIGIDISQLAYPNTGVANYLKSLLNSLLEIDSKNEYVLFFSSMRGTLQDYAFLSKPNVIIKKYKIPPTALDLMWNKLHLMPIESFVGNVDVFLTSDWTEPPAQKAKKVTILYDLLVYKYPNEMHSKIISAQKQKLKWVKKETSKILCISESTKKDAMEILDINKDKLFVINAGI